MLDIKIESLIPFEKIKNDVDSVFQLVDKNNTVVLLKNNQPVYLIVKYAADGEALGNITVASSEGKTAGKRGRKSKAPGSRKARKGKTAENAGESVNTGSGETPKYTLQEAMKLVLAETEGKQMHAAELAEEVYQRGLYLKKNGAKAEYNQLRARCTHYPDLFEALPGNIIKLREVVE